MSTLYVIATPIGNLEDITLRAIRVLKEVECIFCEDTRVASVLLRKFDIGTRTMSYHEHSKLSRVNEIIDMLDQGKDIALISDAGTPGISDPGSFLISKIRDELASKIETGEVKIVAVPGPSALTSAVSISGVNCPEFTFFGFLPHKKGRETILKTIVNLVEKDGHPCIFYESPHRILKVFEWFKKNIGIANETNIKISVSRELTKIFEEVVQGSIQSVSDYFENNKDKVKGEFVVIVYPKE